MLLPEPWLPHLYNEGFEEDELSKPFQLCDAVRQSLCSPTYLPPLSMGLMGDLIFQSLGYYLLFL